MVVARDGAKTLDYPRAFSRANCPSTSYAAFVIHGAMNDSELHSTADVAKVLNLSADMVRVL